MAATQLSMAARIAYEGKFLRLRRAGHWEYVERTRAGGVAVILAITAAGKIILIEQNRPAVGRRVVGLPAGLAGDGKGRSERTLTAARRELWEETGFVSRRWKKLTVGPSSPGLTSEIITFYLAAGAERSPQAPPASDEGIEVHELSPARLPVWLARKEKQGRLIDYKIFAALHLAKAAL